MASSYFSHDCCVIFRPGNYFAKSHKVDEDLKEATFCKRYTQCIFQPQTISVNCEWYLNMVICACAVSNFKFKGCQRVSKIVLLEISNRLEYMKNQ